MLALMFAFAVHGLASGGNVPPENAQPEYVVDVKWNDVPVATTSLAPSAHVPMMHSFARQSYQSGAINPFHSAIYGRLQELGMVRHRFMLAVDSNGLNDFDFYPEPSPPESASRTTSWNFTGIEQFVLDFCGITRGGDCHDTVIVMGPLPPWFFFDKINSTQVCTARDSSFCSGTLVDQTAQAAGNYYSRIISFFTKGGFIDEYGRKVTGGHFLKFNYWEVLNEPNDYAHWVWPIGAVQTYAMVYDGITTVLHRDHPHLQFASMSWLGVVSPSDLEYFLDRSNHLETAPWPPALLTFHIYVGTGNMFGDLMTALKGITAAASIVKKLSPETQIYLDEVGVWDGCHQLDNWNLTLEDGPARFDIWNPRAAWYSALYARSAELGVWGIGASQFFGYPLDAAQKNDWLGRQGQCPNLGYQCAYPCLSTLNWDDITPNPRWWTIKLLIDAFGADANKNVFETIVSPADAVVAAGFELMPESSPTRKALLLVNTLNVSANVSVSWSGPATLRTVDRDHGHGTVPFAETFLSQQSQGQQTFILGPFSTMTLTSESVESIVA